MPLACIHFCPVAAIQVQGKRTRMRGRYQHPDVTPLTTLLDRRLVQEIAAEPERVPRILLGGPSDQPETGSPGILLRFLYLPLGFLHGLAENLQLAWSDVDVLDNRAEEVIQRSYVQRVNSLPFSVSPYVP